MKLIVGLGNPGRGHANNRHNVGFVCLNHFARTQGIRFDKKQGKARIGSGEVAGSKVLLAKPQTYMNRSGQSVRLLVDKFNINPDNLLVIHDDLDLPLGKIRIRRGVGWTTHKGVRSVRDELGSGDFSLLRVGIGRPAKNEGFTEFSEDTIINYVLGDFTPDEKQTITEVIPRVSKAILCLLTEGSAAAMNRYN
jgi:PTH1 family peptidyl-tRNA hydrolase